jgi:hypothetical protein
MTINFNTDKLIILEYPPGAGGKFISLCMALDPHVVHQAHVFAQAKIQGSLDPERSFRTSRAVIEQSRGRGAHFELGCRQLAGFSAGTPPHRQAQEATPLWHTLTNQQTHYFPMVDHVGGSWDHYPHARHVRFHGHEWIMEARQRPQGTDPGPTHPNTVMFDQTSTRRGHTFRQELAHLFDSLALSGPDWDHVEQLRRAWLETFTV